MRPGAGAELSATDGDGAACCCGCCTYRGGCICGACCSLGAAPGCELSGKNSARQGAAREAGRLKAQPGGSRATAAAPLAGALALQQAQPLHAATSRWAAPLPSGTTAGST